MTPIQVDDRVEEWVRYHPGFPDGEFRRGTVLEVDLTLNGWNGRLCKVRWDENTWDENPSPARVEDLRALDPIERLAELA